MSILLLSGYRGSGKDYFYNKLSQDRRSINSLYSIWTSNPNLIPTIKFAFKNKNIKRIAFSSPLKEEVSTQLDMDVQQLDVNKDKLLPNNHNYQWKLLAPQAPTYRHVLIDHAEYRRQSDPYYWIKEASDCIEYKYMNVFTDWRNINELEVTGFTPLHLPLLTARIHRNDVPLPESELVSEHYLTSHKPDILILPYHDNPTSVKHCYGWADEMKYRLYV